MVALKYYTSSSLFERKSARMPSAHFYAVLMREKGHLLQTLVNSFSDARSRNSRAFALYVLWLVDTNESRQLLGEAPKRWNESDLKTVATGLLGRRPKNVLNSPVSSPRDLDLLWATFFATGDSAVVEKITSVVDLAEDGHGRELLLGAAARWSLRSNARQHPRVLEIVGVLARESRGRTAQLLNEIYEEVQEARGRR
ncbi:MAG: hypothetical protein ACE5JN_07955 [Candidatus Methylomirabilia bacterium]